MKIRFDENISYRIVNALRCLETDPLVQISCSHDSDQLGAPDAAWMFEFSDQGGVAMISGDHNILKNKLNLAAYKASGLISIWPPAGWPDFKRWGQASYIVRWWPVIKQRIVTAKRGDSWRLPPNWTPSLEAMKLIGGPDMN